MTNEISNGTMLAIVLLTLAAVIGLGFAVFSIAKGMANEGTVNVQDNLNTVGDSAFDDYNDKIVTGTMVKSAVQNFNGKSVAILINTTAMNNGVKTYSGHEDSSVWKVDSTAGTVVATKAENNKPVGSIITDTTKESYYVNYGALLDASGGEKFTLKDGSFKTDFPFNVDNSTGKVKLDNTIGGFSRSGNCEYISPAAKFSANLIKDVAGATIGVIFTQIKS